MRNQRSNGLKNRGGWIEYRKGGLLHGSYRKGVIQINRQFFLVGIALACLCIRTFGASFAPAGSDATDPFGYPIQTVFGPELRQMLTAGQYQNLNIVLQGYQDELDKDFRLEYKLFDAYDALAVTEGRKTRM